MRGIKFEGAPVFHIMPVTDPQATEISLREHKATVWLRIPPDFSQKLAEAAAGDLSVPTTISLVGDPHAHNYLFAQSLIEQLVREFVDYTLGWQNDGLIVDYEYLPGTGTTSDFEFGVPGMIVFGVMLLVVTTAQILVRERVNGTLRRLRLTSLSAWDLLLGVTLAQMAVALVMVPFTFGAACLMGFQGQGSLLLAMVVGLLLNLGTVGLGLIVACFVRSESEAANLGATVGVLMVIVSGAMYPMPDAPLLTLAGQTVQVYDLLPPTHATEALQQVLLFGEGAGAIGYELAGLSILSGLFLAVGAGLYQRFQLHKT
jgi:ABC-2 type transport system permease protein